MKKLFVLIVLLLPLHLSAHNEPATYDRISFSTTAEMEAPNDELVIIMSVQRTGRDLVELADEVNQTMEWALKQANREKDLKVQTLNYQTSMNYNKGKQEGWRISQSLSLSGTDTETLSKLMGKLQQKMQTQSVSYQVTTEKRNQIREKLTIEALELFSQKADTISQAMNRARYKIVQINLGNNHTPSPRPMAMSRGVMMAAEAVATPSFQAGTQKLTVSATGTIELTD